jgi:hypothetical protein
MQVYLYKYRVFFGVGQRLCNEPTKDSIQEVLRYNADHISCDVCLIRGYSAQHRDCRRDALSIRRLKLLRGRRNPLEPSWMKGLAVAVTFPESRGACSWRIIHSYYSFIDNTAFWVALLLLLCFLPKLLYEPGVEDNESVYVQKRGCDDPALTRGDFVS